MKLFFILSLMLTIVSCGKEVKTTITNKDVSMSSIQSKGITLNQTSRGAEKGLSVICWNNVVVSGQDRINELAAFKATIENPKTIDFASTENGVTIRVPKEAMYLAIQNAINTLSANPTSMTCPNTGSNPYSILSSTY